MLTSVIEIMFRFKQAQLYLHEHADNPVTLLHLMHQAPLWLSVITWGEDLLCHLLKFHLTEGHS